MNLDSFHKTTAGRIVKQPIGYHAFVPHPLPPDIEWDMQLVAQLSTADRALGELAGIGRHLPNPQLLIQPFVRREAVLSSRIEGTQASINDLYFYEAQQMRLFELPDDVQEVNNYVAAMNYALQRLHSLPISLRLIRETHAQLMDGTRGEQWTPGEFRRSQNWIGAPGSSLQTATFVPPPPLEMQDALAALELYVHAPSSLPPLVRLGLIHYQFEAIHPFLDGNGRMGRLLLTLLLVDWEILPLPLLYLSAYFEQHRQQYYAHLLAVSQAGDWHGWLLFFLNGVSEQAQDAIVRVRRLQDLWSQYREEVQRSKKTSARLLQAVDALFEQPVFTIKQLQVRLNVTVMSATRYVQRLEEASIVQEVTGRERNRVYVAQAILDVIEKPTELTESIYRDSAKNI